VTYLLNLFHKKDIELYAYVLYYNIIFNTIFNASIIILLLYLFNPFVKEHPHINKSVRILLFSYAIILFFIFFEKLFEKTILIKNIKKILQIYES
jgi:O-antigen/teichoic acid export membrane protein